MCRINTLPEAIRDLVFFIGAGLFIFFWIRPELILQYQDPVFFTGSDFFSSMIRNPGGFVRYANHFWVQCYIHPVLGSLIITVLIFLVSYFTKKCIQLITGFGRIHSLHLLPAVLCLVLYTQYKYSTASTLGLILACAFFYLTQQLNIRTLRRTVVFLFMAVLVYWLAEGAVWVYGLQCACYEWTRKDRPAAERGFSGLGFLIFSGALPWFALSTVTLGRYPETFQVMMPFGFGTAHGVTALVLYLFLPVLMIKLFLWEKIKTSFSSVYNRCSRMLTGKYGLIIENLIIILIAGISLFFSLNRNGRTIIQIDYYASGQRWPDILKTVRNHPTNDSLVVFHTNRALFHMGLMGSDLFSFRQNLGTDGLLMSGHFERSARIQKSDLLFEMGHVNGSLRWAHEAMSMRGETPRNLERIAEINVLKKDKAYASIAIEKLKKTLFHGKRAKQLEKMLAENSVAEDKRLSRVQFLMPEDDFIISANLPTFDLKKLLDEKPENRMAFEYLMAYYLLARQGGDMVHNLYRIRPFHVTVLPRHYEEAVIFYKMIAGDGPDLAGYKISQASVNRFMDFSQTRARYRNDKHAAHAALKLKHSNTYWFYFLYGKPSRPLS